MAETCAMVAHTVAFQHGEGRRVFAAAEHFFDGYAHDPDTALRVLEAAVTNRTHVAAAQAGATHVRSCWSPPITRARGPRCGAHGNVVAASWPALVDAPAYSALRRRPAPVIAASR